MSKKEVIDFINSDQFDDAVLELDSIYQETTNGFTETYTLCLHRKPVEKQYVLPMEGTNSWSGDEEHIYAFIIARCGGRPVWTTTSKPLPPDASIPSVAKIDYD